MISWRIYGNIGKNLYSEKFAVDQSQYTFTIKFDDDEEKVESSSNYAP